MSRSEGEIEKRVKVRGIDVASFHAGWSAPGIAKQL